MRLVIIYVSIAILVNIVFNTLKPVNKSVRRGFTHLIVITSYPTTKTLAYAQHIIDEYIILISTQKENEKLKIKLAKCELYSDLLKQKLGNPAKKGSSLKLMEVPYSFKSNFETDSIYLRIIRKIDLKKQYCTVLSKKLSLIGIVEKRTGKYIYRAKTVFNPAFVADVYILSNKKKYRALFIGNPYLPKAEFLDPNVEIHEGDKVYTSGNFGVYPPNLLLGTVSSIKNINGYYKIAYINIDRGFFNNWKVFILCKRKL